jgi:ribosomal protein S14
MRNFPTVAAPSQLLLKAVAACQLIPPEYRVFAYRAVTFMAGHKQKMDCYVTGRHRGYVSAYAVSRLIFKAYAMHGIYPGLKKFVW